MHREKDTETKTKFRNNKRKDIQTGMKSKIKKEKDLCSLQKELTLDKHGFAVASLIFG